MKNNVMKLIEFGKKSIGGVAMEAASRISALLSKEATAKEEEEWGVDEAEILGRFIDEVLNPLLNGSQIKLATPYYQILTVDTTRSVVLQLIKSGDVWEIPINTNVFRGANCAAWESFRIDEESFLRKYTSGKRFLVYRDRGCWTNEVRYGLVATWEDGPRHFIAADGRVRSFLSISMRPIPDYLKDSCLDGWKHFTTTVFPNEDSVVNVREDGNVWVSHDLFGNDEYVLYGNPLVDELKDYTHPTNENTTTAVVDPDAGNLRIYESGQLMRVVDVGSPILVVANSKESRRILAVTNDAVYNISTGFYTVVKTHDVVGITNKWKAYTVEDGELKLLVWPDNNGMLEGGEKTALLPKDVAEVEVIDNGLLVLRNNGTFITIAD